MDKLRVHGAKIVDSAGREMLLRGVNLGGSTKVPIGAPTQIVDNFSAHRAVNFVGRPFPRAEARRHFERLRQWGFNVLRFLTTWEAVEHAGPGEYDEAYLDYLTEMVALAGEYGLYVFIDPHQDVWSRMTGGDGAPGWTLEAVGFDVQKLDLSEAAITMQRRYPDYPQMVWFSNHSRLACATMFTLFFAGDRYAPGVLVDGVPVQDLLQGSFIRAMVQIARRVKDMPHVLGFGPLNEPGRGYLGVDDLRVTSPLIQHDVAVSPAEAMLVGAGYARDLPELARAGGFLAQPSGATKRVNTDRIRAWRGDDLWQRVGVWDVGADGEPVICKPDYFAGSDFMRDGLLPFVRRYSEAIRAEMPEAVIFLEGSPDDSQALQITPGELGAIVHAGHWYEVLTLVSKRFDGSMAVDGLNMNLVHGAEAVAQVFHGSIGRLVGESAENLGDVPTLVGEFGIPYDMNDKSAYCDGDFGLHEQALHLYYDALDAHLAHGTLWNYTADNCNAWGDNWNQEDLSIFSPDQQTDPADIHSGGRAVRGFARPSIQRAAGRLIRQQFDAATGSFEAVIAVDATVDAPTIVYVPDVWYGTDYRVTVSSGTTADAGANRLAWTGAAPGEATIRIDQA